MRALAPTSTFPATGDCRGERTQILDLEPVQENSRFARVTTFDVTTPVDGERFMRLEVGLGRYTSAAGAVTETGEPWVGEVRFGVDGKAIQAIPEELGTSFEEGPFGVRVSGEVFENAAPHCTQIQCTGVAGFSDGPASSCEPVEHTLELELAVPPVDCTPPIFSTPSFTVGFLVSGDAGFTPFLRFIEFDSREEVYSAELVVQGRLLTDPSAPAAGPPWVGELTWTRKGRGVIEVREVQKGISPLGLKPFSVDVRDIREREVGCSESSRFDLKLDSWCVGSANPEIAFEPFELCEDTL